VRTLFALLFLSTTLALTAAPSSLTLKLSPGADIPIGESAGYFAIGGCAGVVAAWRMPLEIPLVLNAELGYRLLPVIYAVPRTMHVLSLGVGVGTDLEFIRRLPISLFAGGGYYVGLTEDSGGEPVAGGNPYVSAGGEVSYRLTTNLALGLGGTWTLMLGQPQPLLSSVSARLGVSWRIPLGASGFIEDPLLPEKPALLELSEVRFDDLLPVFYQYYDTHPIGHAVLKNGEKRAARDISVSVFIRSYMDSPKTTTIGDELAPGKSLPLDLFALFTDEVLAITEGTKASVEITLTYTVGGSPRRSQIVETVFLNNRNASIWDDDRRAAAFVTARDPAVLRLAKSVAGIIGDREGLVVDARLATAMALHQALALHGVRYVVDPKTPYQDLVNRRQEIDFLQFPRQTLDYKAGDCDDLAILFCAALEAVDVETAFITIPGHIYAAFALDMAPEKAKGVLRRPEDLILEGGKAWVPVEVTEIKGGFLKAWTLGARQWRENAGDGRAKLHPVREAWGLFAPVGLPGEGETVALPQSAAIAKSFLAENTAFARQQVDERAAVLQQEIARAKDKNPLINKLGVLYARFGLVDQAEKEFRKATAGQAYVPSLINLGSVLFVKDDLKGALALFQQARKKAPDNVTALLNIALVSHALGDYGVAKQSYDQLATIAPAVAEEYGHLAQKGDEGARAAEASGLKEAMRWED
jgi:tetratricopeptide (TPR) repeat protein